MSSAAFTQNYRDHSNDTGFQFEFFCERCGNGFRSAFQSSALGVGAKLLHGLGSFFGGGRGHQAGWAADHMKDAVRGPAWDAAFKKAIDEIKPKFKHCTRCGNWVCPEACWNEQRGLCENCAPDLAEEAAHHQAHIASQQIADKMRDVDLVAGIDVKADMLGQCPHCQGRLPAGAKFCSGCGKPVGTGAAKAFCSQCGSQLPPGGRFCASCGAAAAT